MAARIERIDRILSKLESVRIKSIVVAVVTALVVAALVLGVGWLVTSLLDLELGLRNLYLKVIATTFMAAAIGGFGYWIVRVFSVSHSLRAYAARIAAELEEVGHDLLTALDLAEVDSERLGYSRPS